MACAFSLNLTLTPLGISARAYLQKRAYERRTLCWTNCAEYASTHALCQCPLALPMPTFSRMPPRRCRRMECKFNGAFSFVFTAGFPDGQPLGLTGPKPDYPRRSLSRRPTGSNLKNLRLSLNDSPLFFRGRAHAKVSHLPQDARGQHAHFPRSHQPRPFIFRSRTARPSLTRPSNPCSQQWLLCRLSSY